MKEEIYVFNCLFSIMFNPGQGFLNILDKSTVEEGEVFTMTCDYLRFNFTNVIIDYVFHLQLSRKLFNESKDTYLYVFIPVHSFETRYFKMYPRERLWDVWADHGGDDYRGQKEKVKLTIAVLDTNMADSGNYTCFMQYFTHKMNSKTRTEQLTVTKSTYLKPTYTRKNLQTTPEPTRPATKAPASNQPILDKSTVKEGESFTVTCDYKRFDIVNTGILFDNLVKCVTLSRRLDGSLNYTLIYCFCPYIAKCDRISGIPPGRSWNVHIDHGDHDHYIHQEFISLSVTVNDTILADSGSYECDELFGTNRRHKRSETLKVIQWKTTRNTTAGNAGIKMTTPQITTAVSKVIKGETEQIATAGCEDFELTTPKNQSNNVGKKDYHHSTLLLLVFILLMTWLL